MSRARRQQKRRARRAAWRWECGERADFRRAMARAGFIREWRPACVLWVRRDVRVTPVIAQMLGRAVRP